MGRKPLGRWFRRNLMWFVPLQSICLDPFVTVNNWFWFSERHQFSLILWEVAFASCDFYPISSKSFSLYIFKGIEYLQLKVFSCTKPKKVHLAPLCVCIWILCSVILTLWDPVDGFLVLQTPLSMGFAGENTGVGCRALFQGNFWA